jgi:RNA polymerase sigma-70 factor (ECF subfamily)
MTGHGASIPTPPPALPPPAPAPAPAPPDDKALLRAWVQNRDEGAYEELVNRYQRPLASFVRRYLSDPAEISDVVQDAFVALIRCGANLLTANEPLSSWLFRVAYNRAMDHFRRHTRQKQKTATDISATDDPLAGATSRTEDEAASERLEALRLCRQALDPQLRLLLYLLYDEQFTLAEAAPYLGYKSPSSLSRLCRRAEEQLRECITKRLNPPSPPTSGGAK